MTNEDQWEFATKRLSEMTNSGDISWGAETGSRDIVHEPVGTVFVAKVNDELVRVYEYEYLWTDENENSSPMRDVMIEFLTPTGRTSWQFPKNQYRWKLLDVIRYKNSNAEQFLQKLFKK